jgi:hypothetical protein
MARDIAFKVYQFNELSEDAKKKAREWYKEVLNNDFGAESEMITLSFEGMLEEYGYPTEDINWSLTCSQGDGMAFYGKIEELERVAKRLLDEKKFKRFKLLVNAGLELEVKIKRNSFGVHYNHYNTMWVDWEAYPSFIFDGNFKKIENFCEDFINLIEEDIKNVSKELEASGYKQIDHYYSDEAIDETIISNEYEFTAEGKRWA